MTTPSAAASSSPAPSSIPSAPTPIATIDSPSAMITIRLWRSAKWPGESRQPPIPRRPPPAKSITSTTIHSDGLGGLVEQGADDQQHRRERGRDGERAGGLAHVDVLRGGREQPDVHEPHPEVGHAKSSASSSNAPGTASEASSIAIIAPKIASRTAQRRLSTSFVSHAYAAHAHQIDASTSMPRSSPPQDRSWASRAVTCVRAKTKTRSKNSSSGSTRLSDWFAAARRCGGTLAAVRAQQRDRVDGHAAARLPRDGGVPVQPVEVPAAVVALAGRDRVERPLDRGGVEQRADRAVRARA